jgi:rRNA maturation endonuclease Nob1
MADNRTTELRAKLTERGVKYDVKALRETEWAVNGVIWHANEYDGKLNVYVRNNDMLLTPDQAIAATLGSGTCEVVSSYYYDDYDQYEFEFSCGHSITTYEKDPFNFCPICGARIRKAVER